jgi:hypothetical protein
MGSIMAGIRDGRWKERVEAIREKYVEVLLATGDREEAKKAIGELKKRLPGILWSGKFSSRANANLVKHSGLLCADLDGLGERLPEVREKLPKSSYVLAAFLSPSGDGLKVVFRVPPDGASHLASYRAVERYVLDLCSIEIDQSCKDAARMCFASFDPALYLNEGAIELPPMPETERPKNASHTSNGSTPPMGADPDARLRIVQETAGPVQEIGGKYFVRCPGQHLHTQGNGPKDCEVYLDRVPTIHCVHRSCAGILAGVNHELRSRIAKAERLHLVREPRAAENGVTPKEESIAYFDAGRNLYWIRDRRNSWIAINETQFKRILRQQGTSPKVPEGSYVSPVDELLIEVQQCCDVHYAGALAGCSTGVYDMGERRILVTESPRIIEPKPGDWPTLEKFLDGLLNDPHFDQRPYLYGWIKVAFEALRAGVRRPGQGLVLAGPHDSGKSLKQNIITVILGGRSARPYQYMSGLTPFNSDLFEAEHLMIEDEQASTDIRARRNFGAQLKNITVVDWQRCHAKNRVAVTLAPFWRLSITVNDEPENLMVLPPIDDSIKDKLIILRAAKKPMPMPTANLEQRRFFWEKLLAELPAFLHFLTQWEIPLGLVSERFGITHFHHPEILEAIDSLAPEFRLLRLIDEVLFECVAAGEWEGTAEHLERQLCADASKCRNEARKLFTFNTACGVYLSRLAKKNPARFEKDRNADRRSWTIHPP